jgi:hypothetical protein
MKLARQFIGGKGDAFIDVIPQIHPAGMQESSPPIYWRERWCVY